MRYGPQDLQHTCSESARESVSVSVSGESLKIPYDMPNYVLVVTIDNHKEQILLLILWYLHVNYLYKICNDLSNTASTFLLSHKMQLT